MKTVKQIADELNTSLSTVYRRLSKLQKVTKEPLIEKTGNITYFTDAGEELIIRCFAGDNQNAKVINDDNQTENAEILFLREQINAMNTEKLKLLEQIDKLTETVKIQAESINAAHHNELAETIIDSRNLPSPVTSKVSLWNRLFKRK